MTISGRLDVPSPEALAAGLTRKMYAFGIVPAWVSPDTVEGQNTVGLCQRYDILEEHIPLVNELLKATGLKRVPFTERQHIRRDQIYNEDET